MVAFREAGTQKTMLPCRRREHFAKTGRRGNGHEKGCQKGGRKAAKTEPKWLLGRTLGELL